MGFVSRPILTPAEKKRTGPTSPRVSRSCSYTAGRRPRDDDPRPRLDVAVFVKGDKQYFAAPSLRGANGADWERVVAGGHVDDEVGSKAQDNRYAFGDSWDGRLDLMFFERSRGYGLYSLKDVCYCGCHVEKVENLENRLHY